MTPQELALALVGYRFRFNNEKELQYGIGMALSALHVVFTPEVILDAESKDRIDFLTAEGIGIEVKTNDARGGAGLASVTRQLWRYAKSGHINALILVTTRSKHRDLPKEILGKPLYVVYLNSFL